MKSYNDLLKFYGVEEGCSYIVTKTKKEKYKDFVGNRFVVERWYKTDEFGILFCGKSMLYYTFLNDFEYSKTLVLDTTEKRYLKNVIRPFKNKVLYIVLKQVDTKKRNGIYRYLCEVKRTSIWRNNLFTMF